MKNKLLCCLMAVLCVASLFFTGCKKKDSGEVETVFAVYAMKAKPSNLDDYLDFGGNVQASSSVDIYTDVQSGKISTVYASVGDRVSKGQVIAEVDASRPGMEYKVSPVKAPVSGTITSLPINVGSTVSASMPIGKVSSTKKLEIKTNVAERFISRIKLNQKAELTFDAFPGEKFPARVVEIDPVLDTTSRTLGIKLIQEPADPRLKAGMFACIKLITETRKNTIVIPANVIVNRNGQEIVYVVNETEIENADSKDGEKTVETTVSVRPVKKGIKIDNRQEVLEGIEPGDIVVIKGQALLSEGVKVKVINVAE